MLHLRRSLIVSVVVSSALVLGVVSPAYATGAAAHPTITAPVVSASTVPPLAVTPANPVTASSGASDIGVSPTVVTGVAPAPKATAPKASSSYNPITSSPISYTQDSTLYQNADGSQSRQVSLTPINYQKPDGSWVPIGTTVDADQSTGGYSVADNPLHPQFAAGLGTGADVTVNSGDDPVSFSLQGESTASASVPDASQLQSVSEGLGSAQSAVGSSLQYTDALGSENLQYQVTDSGVKETLVVPSVPSASQTTWSWLIHAPGLTLSQSDRGSLYLTDANGVVQYSIPDPIMWDSSGVAGQSNAALVDVPFTFAQTSDGDWNLTLTPQQSWLDDPARVYPVYIDPTVELSVTAYTAYESNGTVVANSLRAGNSRDSGDTYWRTVVYFQYDGLEGSDPTNWADEVTPNPYFATQYFAGTANLYTGYIIEASGWGFNDISSNLLSEWAIGTSPVTNTDNGIEYDYQYWMNAGSDGGTLMYIGDETAGLYTYKQIDAQLYLNYETAATIAPYAPTGGVATAINPVLSSTVTPNNSTGPYTYSFEVSTHSDPDTSPVWTSNGFTSTSPYMQVPINVLTAGTTYYWKESVEDANGAIRSTSITSAPSFVPSAPGTITQTGSSPADNTIDPSLTPTLSVATPGVLPGGGTPTQYQFVISSGTDGISGQVVASPTMSFPGSGPMTWTVPAGVLQDGGSYTWTVFVEDSLNHDYWSWVNRLKINTRIADSGPAPTDAAGPVTVNLANGNVSASFTTPTVSTVGGAMGMSFNYNSLEPSNAGLTGTYYDATNGGTISPNFTFPTSLPMVLQRTDPMIDFQWGTSSPAPNVPSQNLMAQWTGYMNVPTTGTYSFGFTGSDTGKAVVGGTTADSMTTANTTGTPVMGTGLALTAGPNSITVQYTNATDVPSIALWVSGPGISGNEIVPASWFTRSVESLPGGWSSSQAFEGDAANFVSEQDNGSSIVFTDSSGAQHTYTKNSASGSGYTPPPGEDGVVSVDSGVVDFTDDAGTVYVFNAAGQLVSATTAEDINKPAEPIPAYNANGQILSLSNPLSSNGATPPVYGSQVTFTYANTSNTGSWGACVAPTSTIPLPNPADSFAAATAGFLCEISYPDGSNTNLYYNQNEQLAEVVNPGAAITTFGYAQGLGGEWLLTEINTPLVNDWTVDDNGDTPSATASTTITYDDGSAYVGNANADWAASVQLPSPNGTTAAQPEKIYTYDASPASPCALGTGAYGTSCVDTVPATSPLPADGHTEVVNYNASLQETSVTDAMGLTSTETWDGSDDPLTSVDPQGLETSTIYDSQDRPTDVYGPAPSSCFASTPAPTSCTVGSTTLIPGHTSTSYDGGLAGLAATYYSLTSLSGVPTAFALGIGGASGALSSNWPTALPTGVPSTDFSAQLSGTITFPSAGSYTFTVAANYSAELYINDVFVADASAYPAAGVGTFTATAGEVARIRVVYEEEAEAPALNVTWLTPGAGSAVTIPGTALSPDYSLTTATETADSSSVSGATVAADMETTTSYGSSPWLGQAASTTAGAGILNLTSTATYDTTGTDTDQLTSSTKPAGSATATSLTYFTPASETDQTAYSWTTARCGVLLTQPQYGQLKETASPAPASGGTLIQMYLYDVMGRVAGTEEPNDTTWSCTTYDSRGRVSTVSTPAYGTASARTVTYNYAVGSDPEESSVSDASGTVYTWVDLDGNVTKTEDVLGTVTTNTYNQLGQLTKAAVVPPSTTGEGEQDLGYSYDPDGNLTTETLNGDPIAEPSYNSTEQLTGVSYPAGGGDAGNGTSLSSVSYALTGQVASEGWAFVSGDAVTDTDTYSQAGQVVEDYLTNGSVGYTRKYSYDADGRLTAAALHNDSVAYTYGSSGGCGADAAAGNDGNRTGFTQIAGSSSPSYPTSTSVSYCYDNADRLTSDTVTGAPAGSAELLSTNLTSSNLVYDNHGDITTLGDETMTYDDTGRNLTDTTGSTTVTYSRDPENNIIGMKTVVTGGSTTTVQYTGGGGIQFTLNGSGGFQEEDLSLPGGVTVAITTSGVSPTEIWSYPDLHGDDTVTADQTGARNSAFAYYDPFGNPMDLSTDLVGTINANAAVPDNTITDSNAKRGRHIRVGGVAFGVLPAHG